MRTKLMVGAVLALAAGLGVGVAVAAPRIIDAKDRPPAEVHGAHTEAAIAAEAGEARMVVHVQGDHDGFEVKRQAGVQTVTNPVAGRFCIRPTDASGVHPNKVVPSVSTDYYGTSGFDGFAQWNSLRQGCPTGTFTINTFDASEGTALNDVAFTVVVV